MARQEWDEDRDRGRGEWRSREWDSNRSETRERPGRWNRPDGQINPDRLRDEWRSDAWRGWDRGDEWRDWGRGETGDLRGREGGWGGYGSYDRERASESRRYPEPYQQGRYAGRGPKNYQRSDERVREDVVEKLTDHPDLDATDIDVEVQHCEVTLRGEVDERYAKHLAEDLAGQVWGVHDVHNQLHIRKSKGQGAPKN
jgi:hypothetical protein